MAPEVVNVDPDEGARYDDKVDIFSFGFVLFEMVFGQHPYPKLINNRTCSPLSLSSPFLLPLISL